MTKLTGISLRLYNIALERINSNKELGLDFASFSATLPKDVQRRLMEDGYRIILKDFFDGNIAIRVVWAKDYKPSRYWEHELHAYEVSDE